MKRKKKDSSKSMSPNSQGEVYLCTGCGKKEMIPEDVLEYFDLVNPRNPSTGPHDFSCETCGAEMYPEWWLKKQERVPE